MTALTDLTIAGAAEGLSKGDFSSHELTATLIEAVEGARGLNAFITETPEIALARAKESDARRKNGGGK